MRSALALHLADIQDLPKPRGIDAYLEALSDSEGEIFYLTHVLVESIIAKE
jgi:hypothetical protein